MKVQESKLSQFMILNSALEKTIHNVAQIFNLTESRRPYKSLRARTHYRKKWSYKKDQIEVVNIGLFSHNILRNLELIHLKRNIDFFSSPVLDLGCGNGQFGSLILESIDAGVDMSPESVLQAQDLNLYGEVKVADCTQEIPFYDGCFNTVFSNSVLEHISDLDGVIGEVSRVLDKGGRFIMTTYSNKFAELLNEKIGEDLADRYNSALTHVSLHDMNYWKDLLNSNRMVIEKVETYLPIETLLDMLVYRSRPFVVSELVGGKFFWNLTKEKLHAIVSSSLDTENGLGFLLVAKKV